jgi:limonene-1,2-epoxide hydrolase
MKQFILYTLLTTCFFSCTSSADQTAAADKTPVVDSTSVTDKTPPASKRSEENITLVNKYFAAIENHDTAAMSSLMADNYKGYGPSIGDSAGKLEILENWKYNFDHFYATIKYDRFQNIATSITENNDAEPGDWVSNWAYCSVNYKDKRGPIHLWVNSVFKIENGKILKNRVFYNEADWLRQLGYNFIKPVKKKQGESL